MIDILRRDKYIYREEYIKLLSTRSIHEALRTLVGKIFAPRILEGLEKGQLSFTDVVKKLDEYNLEIAFEELLMIKEDYLKNTIEAIYEVYPVITALLSYQETGRLVSHLPSKTVRILEESLEKPPASSINPFINRILADYRAQRKLDVDSVIRVLDSVRNTVKNIQDYHEFLVTSIAYDILLLSLCSHPLFRDSYLRPLLINASEMQSICKLIEVDPVSAIDSLKKTRPIFTGLIGLASDIEKITTRHELLELILYLYPPYISWQVLHFGDSKVVLKNALLYLRQSLLTRLSFTFIHEQDEILVNQLRSLIERWIYP